MKTLVLLVLSVVGVVTGLVPRHRRAFFAQALVLLTPQVAPAVDSPVKREINSFIDLVYHFKNTALDGGLDASTINEPSISFIEFGEKMQHGDVTMVEFIAPSGEVAYCTFQEGGKEKRVRIGQGYPTISKNSWSSPDYVIRSVSNFGVPYKFTVPALARYNRRI